MHYVGLSRVRNSSNLHILNLNENKIKVSQAVQYEMHRLRTEATLKSNLPNLFAFGETSALTVLFHNVRSLNLHIEDIRSDYNVQAADINIFVETGLCVRDADQTFDIPTFTLHRNDINSSQLRTKYGTAFYIKNNIKCVLNPLRCNYNGVEITIMTLHYNNIPLHIIEIYRSSSLVTIRKLIEGLKYIHDEHNLDSSCSKIFIGDFNVNIRESSPDTKKLLDYFLSEKKYTQLIQQYTTDYKSTLDHIYTNIPLNTVYSGVLESYYSDHKPIFIQNVSIADASNLV